MKLCELVFLNLLSIYCLKCCLLPEVDNHQCFFLFFWCHWTKEGYYINVYQIVYVDFSDILYITTSAIVFLTFSCICGWYFSLHVMSSKYSYFLYFFTISISLSILWRTVSFHSTHNINLFYIHISKGSIILLLESLPILLVYMIEMGRHNSLHYFIQPLISILSI